MSAGKQKRGYKLLHEMAVEDGCNRVGRYWGMTMTCED